MKPTGQDPHRTLGVAPGAGEAEIKRAYRALAKRYHPDAREGSAARFIEIQAAYEALLGTAAPGASPAPRPGRRPAQAGGARASGAGGGGAGGGGAGTPAGSTWARRPRDPGAGRSGTQASDGASTRDGRSRPGAAAGKPSEGASWTGSTGDGRRRGHGRRRASLGSTSYDEAEEVFEPDWAGATWYGASSGTYWTINPKEYADPRKHGPEYQARARRRAAGAGRAGPGAEGNGSVAGNPPPRADDTDGAGAGGSPTTSRASGSRQARRPTTFGQATPGDLPPDWRAQAWTAAGIRGADRPTFEHESPPPPPEAAEAGGSSAPPPRAPTPGPSPAGFAATGPATPSADGPRTAARVVLAFAGWAVPGLALAAFVGLPGGFAATLPLQAAGIALLALVPRLAWAAAGGGLAVVFAAIPIVAFLAALSGQVVPGEPMPVAAVLAGIVWGAGLVAVGSGRMAPFPWRPGG